MSIQRLLIFTVLSCCLVHPLAKAQPAQISVSTEIIAREGAPLLFKRPGEGWFSYPRTIRNVSENGDVTYRDFSGSDEKVLTRAEIEKGLSDGSISLPQRIHPKPGIDAVIENTCLVGSPVTCGGVNISSVDTNKIYVDSKNGIRVYREYPSDGTGLDDASYRRFKEGDFFRYAGETWNDFTKRTGITLLTAEPGGAMQRHLPNIRVVNTIDGHNAPEYVNAVAGYSNLHPHLPLGDIARAFARTGTNGTPAQLVAQLERIHQIYRPRLDHYAQTEPGTTFRFRVQVPVVEVARSAAKAIK